ncbi:alpha/beta hydrolase [Haloterrigena sp. SYSU A558-1]|uniref:Alpha/beta hydrolase n=1 Tax=Haloterrigena gelatinilytica TaxID=2741724 RepID=A0A8J8GJG8_9EURY|nr:alpha/beta hydrolase [Haloterrigena gelatinilytica]NUB89454.1 alpha/beta hydrolase [Haloterrigena gelatinilytica]NUC74712.1 alpha/beta hydrolase [Haloterrigena gelatinilytica]
MFGRDSESGTDGMDGIDVAGAGNDRSIVFVHGAMFTRKMWLPQQRALSSEYRVVTFDLPGHGAYGDEQFRMEPAVERLERAIEEHTDGTAVVVGLSLGGYVATEYVARRPETVDGLVLSGSSVNPVGGMETLTRATGGISRLATKPDIGCRAVEKLGYRWVRNRDLPADIEREIIDSGIYPREFGNAGPFVAGEDFRGKLSTYPGPTLVLNGENDKLMRRGEREHAAAARDGRVEVLAGVGHICNLHRPETYTDRVRNFVRQRVAARR